MGGRPNLSLKAAVIEQLLPCRCTCSGVHSLQGQPVPWTLALPQPSRSGSKECTAERRLSKLYPWCGLPTGIPSSLHWLHSD